MLPLLHGSYEGRRREDVVYGVRPECISQIHDAQLNCLEHILNIFKYLHRLTTNAEFLDMIGHDHPLGSLPGFDLWRTSFCLGLGCLV